MHAESEANTSHQITEHDHQRRKREVRDRRRGYCAQYVIDNISNSLQAVCGRLDPKIWSKIGFSDGHRRGAPIGVATTIVETLPLSNGECA